MSNKRTKRILKEFQELEESRGILEDSRIYFEIQEDNINFIKAMLIGPKDTPYENGYYFFTFEYPPNYPMSPPIAKFMTNGTLKTYNNNNIHIRFNPNLYVKGKVCLSMLNTWSGPGWVPTNTITNVLVAIQALVLIENPLLNEPGFENASIERLEKYNRIIRYANIKISILDTLQNPLPEFSYFIPIMKSFFINNIQNIKDLIIKYQNMDADNLFMDAGVYELKNIKEDYNYLSEYLENTIYFIQNLENSIIESNKMDDVVIQMNSMDISDVSNEVDTNNLIDTIYT